MKQLIIGLIIGSVLGGMWVQYRFSGGILSNKPKEELCPEIVELAEPTEYCYFQDTFGDVVREKKLDCRKYKNYEAYFNTIHWDSLPHGSIK